MEIEKEDSQSFLGEKNDLWPEVFLFSDKQAAYAACSEETPSETAARH